MITPSHCAACAACGGATCVYDSRPTNVGIRRRRKCMACDERHTTYEIRWPGGGPGNMTGRVALLESVLSLPPATIAAVIEIAEQLRNTERHANRWKRMARALWRARRAS